MSLSARVRRTSSERSLLLALVCAAPFMVVLDSNLVTVALPSIRTDLDLSAQHLQWVLTAYALPFGSFLLVGGRAGDLLGRRRMLRIGVGVFATASLAGALAPSAAVLICARAIQGLGAALAFPAAVSVITSTFDEGVERDRALGVYGAAASAAFVGGVLLGGGLTNVVGWRAVLLVNVPLGALVVTVAGRVVPESHGVDRSGALELRGALLSMAAMVALIYGLTTAAAAGGLSESSAACFALAAALASRGRLRAAIGRHRALAAAVAAAVLTVGTGVGTMFVLTLYLQDVLGFAPFASGLVLTSMGVSGVAAGMLVPKLAARLGTVPLLATLLLVQAGGVFATVPIGAGGGLALVILGTAAMGAGHFGATVLFTSLAASGVRDAEQGVTAGRVSAAQQIGGAFGLAVVVAVASARTEAVAVGAHDVSALVAGFRWGLATAAAMSLLAALLVWLLAGGRRQQPAAKPAENAWMPPRR